MRNGHPGFSSSFGLRPQAVCFLFRRWGIVVTGGIGLLLLPSFGHALQVS